jgi:hypothetical protein
MTDQAPAADTSKETKHDAPDAHKEAAAGALDKMKVDAAPAKADAKSADQPAKKELAVDHQTEGHKSFTESVLDEMRNSTLGKWYTGKSDTAVNADAPSKASADPAHLDITPLNYGDDKKPLAAADSTTKGPGNDSWTWGGLWNSGEEFLKSAANKTWDVIGSGISYIENMDCKFTSNATTKSGGEAAYKQATDNLAALSKDINSDGKSYTKDGVSYHFSKDGDAMVDSKNLSVLSEKNGDRLVTDKRTGDIFKVDPKSGEVTRTEKNGHVTQYSKEEVTNQYGDWFGVVNKLSDNAGEYGRKLAMGEAQTDPDGKIHYQGIDRKVTIDKAAHTITMDMMGNDGKPSGVSFTIDHKTHMVTINDHGQTTTESTKDFFAHNKLAQGLRVHGSHIDMDGMHEGHDHVMHAQTVSLDNSATSSDPALRVKNNQTGESVSVDGDGKGKFEEIHRDAQGALIGNKVEVDAHNKAHVYEEVNDKGVVVTNIDTTKGFDIAFKNDDGTNLWNMNPSGNMCFGTPGDSDYFSLSPAGIFTDSKGENLNELFGVWSFFERAQEKERQRVEYERQQQAAADENEANEAASEAYALPDIPELPTDVNAANSQVAGVLDLAIDALYEGEAHNNSSVIAAASSAIAAINDEQARLDAVPSDGPVAA